MTSPPLDQLARRARRARARSRARIRVLVTSTAVVVAIGATGFGWLLLRDDGHSEARRPAPATTTTAAAIVEPFEPFTIATTRVPLLGAVEQPAEGQEPTAMLSDTTEYGLPRTLLVVDRRPGWLQVLLPIRPNQSTGWVRESDVTLSETTYELRVELAAHRLTLLNAGQVVLEAPTVNGKPETPTPPGRYYVTDPVDLTANPNGAYGAYALGISGYSDVLMEFLGGPGQLAVHGTVETGLLGGDHSNGCIRVSNDVIMQIATAVPVGTPVTIV